MEELGRTLDEEQIVERVAEALQARSLDAGAQDTGGSIHCVVLPRQGGGEIIGARRTSTGEPSSPTMAGILYRQSPPPAQAKLKMSKPLPRSSNLIRSMPAQHHVDALPGGRTILMLGQEDMPGQESFLKESAGPVTVEVVKTYDRGYAREVFDRMKQDAKEALAHAMELNEKFEPEDIPNSDALEYDDFLWEELNEDSLEDARQYPRQYSFFVVSVSRDGKSQDRYVSTDWPSAERYAKSALRREA
jgi:hypothetical protein